MQTVSENRCFGGTQGVYTHASTATGTDMTFGLFLPAEAADGPQTFRETRFNISSRSRTATEVSWTPPAWLREGSI